MSLNPPRYRREKVYGGHDRAFIELNRRRHWLGRSVTAESHQRYAQFVEWQATGGNIADEKDGSRSRRLPTALMANARAVYRRADRTPIKEAANFERALPQGTQDAARPGVRPLS